MQVNALVMLMKKVVVMQYFLTLDNIDIYKTKHIYINAYVACIISTPPTTYYLSIYPYLSMRVYDETVE